MAENVTSTTLTTTDEAGDPRVFMDVVMTHVADQIVGFDVARETPVLPSVYSSQKIMPDLYANELGIAMLIYKDTLPAEVWWVEYDPGPRRLIFVALTGQVFDLGMAIHENVDFFLRFAQAIHLVKIADDGAVLQADERKLVVRGNGTQKI